jgi:tRNA 2-thiouridine synthesizing protein A
VKDPPPPIDQEWDAGDLGCGELVLELRLRLGRMRPGRIIKVTALDPGAPADMPAWCRLTGHTLVSGEHPVYLIRRKENTSCPTSSASA